MLQEPKLGLSIIASVSGGVLIVFLAAAFLDPGSIVIADWIIDFLSSVLERFVHENERQIVESTLTRIA